MAKYNVENEQVEIHIERLFKYSPELVYSAWTDINLLKAMVYDLPTNK